MEKPMYLQGVCKDYLWGGTRLRTEYGKDSDSEIIAESWELACHKDGNCMIRSGSFNGKTLQEYLTEHPEALGTNCPTVADLPLIKLIDAKKDLSIQVHPDDEYAQRVEGEHGKTEMWYILDCLPGSALYYGVSRKVSPEEFAQRIADNTVTEILNRVEVHPGELYFIPAGTIHAIGEGILLAEIQQNSNTTYRVYDYARRGADGQLRPLHVEKAKEVSNLEPIADTTQYPDESVDGGTRRLLESCDQFTSHVLKADGVLTETVDTDSFLHLLVIGGIGTLETNQGESLLQKGNSIFIPAGTGEIRLTGTLTVIATRR